MVTDRILLFGIDLEVENPRCQADVALGAHIDVQPLREGLHYLGVDLVFVHAHGHQVVQTFSRLDRPSSARRNEV